MPRAVTIADMTLYPGDRPGSDSIDRRSMHATQEGTT